MGKENVVSVVLALLIGATVLYSVYSVLGLAMLSFVFLINSFIVLLYIL